MLLKTRHTRKSKRKDQRRNKRREEVGNMEVKKEGRRNRRNWCWQASAP
jgi:hypothetical protein